LTGFLPSAALAMRERITSSESCARVCRRRASSGADEKKSIKFNAEKIRPYAYRVTLDASLKSGEYAFIASTGIGGASSGFGGASGGASVVVFDFGVDR